MKRLIVFTLTVFILSVAILVDLPMWVYWLGLAIAADQVYTKIYYANNEYQFYSLFMTVALVAIFYLPEWEAFLALSPIGLITAIFAKTEMKKRIFNAICHAISIAGLIFGYTITSSVLDSTWPSVEAFFSMVVGLCFYELINALTFSLVIPSTFKEWTKTITLPITSAIAAITISLLLNLNALWVPFGAGLIIAILQPVYRLPGIRSINPSVTA
jgi:hypothetical protein